MRNYRKKIKLSGSSNWRMNIWVDPYNKTRQKYLYQTATWGKDKRGNYRNKKGKMKNLNSKTWVQSHNKKEPNKRKERGNYISYEHSWPRFI